MGWFKAVNLGEWGLNAKLQEALAHMLHLKQI